MPIILAIAGTLFLAAIFGPQVWIRHVLKRHGGERPDLPGNGGELARHLLDEANLHDVKVETTDLGDHYDPEARAVRLLPQHHDGRSVTAVAIAAHEVSHAVQHAREEPGFIRRYNLVKRYGWVEKVAFGVLITAPFIFMLIRSPALLIVNLLAAFALIGIRVAVHVTTLPVEFDASFGKALPVLERGRYLSDADMPAARSVLRAAAYTYVAAALATLLDVVRWFR